LDRKIRGLGPRGHCRELELIRARPPPPPAVKVAGRVAEEEEGSTMTVKVVMEEQLEEWMAGRPFIWSEGERGSRAAAVVHHNGDEGGRFGRLTRRHALSVLG
jgi:hypothetical protein